METHIRDMDLALYGVVKIVNRKKLEDSACECCGVIRQYDGELGLK